MTDSPPRVALVTGSRKGIGRRVAEHFLEAGYAVVGCSREASDWSHERYEHFTADVSQEDAVVTMLDAVRRRHGGLAVLVNNAGTAAMNHLLLTPGETLDRLLRTNLLGTMLVSREAAKVMTRGRWGRIVSFTTVAVPLQLEGEAAYVASKAGVEAFTRVLAREVAPMGITVNAVGLPPIETDLLRGVPREKRDALIGRLALRRMGTFDDVTNIVDFLIRPESSAVTGQIIYLGGP